MSSIKSRKIVSVLSSVFCICYLGNHLNLHASTKDSFQSPVSDFHVYDTRLNINSTNKSTIKNLIINGLNLIGRVNYIWGGGRNTVDGKRIVDTIGIPSDWKKFSSSHDYSSMYDWKSRCNGEEVNWRDIHNGLDCSGFMSWLIKNTVKSKNPEESFLTKARDMAGLYGNKKLGNYSDFGTIARVCPGDVISMKHSYDDNGQLEDESHVYLALGQFNDGSILMLDMSGEGTIMIRGTRTREAVLSKDTKNLKSEAIDAAKYCMKRYYPDTYRDWKLESNNKYICYKDSYTLDSSMHWYTKGDKSVIDDPEGYQNMSPYEVLSNLFGKVITRSIIVNEAKYGNIRRKRLPHNREASNKVEVNSKPS